MAQTTALEFQRKFGEFQHQAQREPVEITRHGRRELVLMSADHYDWLVAAARRTHRTAEAASVVADAVRRAAMEGRMDGRNYVGCNCGAGADCPETRVCVVGHIALALDSYEDGHDGLEAIPMVPNWNYHIAGISPIESLVEDVRPGDTPETSRYLATLVHWVDGWMNAHAEAYSCDSVGP